MKKIILFLLLSYSVYSQTIEVSGVNVPKIYYETLQKYCKEFDVPISYAARLIEWESNWDYKKINKNSNGTTDYGLMMHNSYSIPDFQYRYNNGVTYDPFNWKDNIRIGLKHLSVLRSKTESWFGAVCAYNMGLTAFNNWLDSKRDLPTPTLKLIQFVLDKGYNMKDYKAMGNEELADFILKERYLRDTEETIEILIKKIHK